MTVSPDMGVCRSLAASLIMYIMQRGLAIVELCRLPGVLPPSIDINTPSWFVLRKFLDQAAAAVLGHSIHGSRPSELINIH